MHSDYAACIFIASIKQDAMHKLDVTWIIPWQGDVIITPAVECAYSSTYCTTYSKLYKLFRIAWMLSDIILHDQLNILGPDICAYLCFILGWAVYFRWLSCSRMSIISSERRQRYHLLSITATLSEGVIKLAVQHK
jgi:hypothetical protein